MRGGHLGSCRDDDEVAVPRLELLEAEQDLVPLGAAHRPPRSLVLLAAREVELLVLGLSALLRLLGPLGRDAHHDAGRLAGLERRIPVDRTRDLEQGLAPTRRIGVEQPVDPVEPPAGHARQGRRLVVGQLGRPRPDLVANRRLGQPPKLDELAPRKDRLGERPEVVGDEHRHGVRRRLLEVLEQRIGRLFVQRVRPEDEVDAPIRLEGPHVQVAAQLADRVDPDLVAERLEHVQVGMRAALDASRVTE